MPLSMKRQQTKCPRTGRSPQGKPRRCIPNVNIESTHKLACAQVLYPCMCMQCPHAYFKRSLPCPCSPRQRKLLFSSQWHRFASNWWLDNPSEHQKLKNKCKLSITTLLSGIVGKSGALTTFHFLLDLGNFNIAMFSSIVREPSLLG